MRDTLSDTIVALSTPEGSGMNAVLRVCGEGTKEVLKQLGFPKIVAGIAESGEISLGDFSLPACCIFRQGPHSYTRENLAEISFCSSPPLVQAVLKRILERGTRLAQPGEFTRRAFLNGRLDLTQAEGVLELIYARNESQRRSGLSLLEGGLTTRIDAIRDPLEAVLALLEASLDFEEGETGHIDHAELAALLGEARKKLDESLQWEEKRVSFRKQIEVFFWGKPNAGKSSLINRLDPKARSIVSPIAGTTRDCLAGEIEIEGIRFRLLDAPGEEEVSDLVGKKTQELASRFRESADLVIWVADASEPKSEIPKGRIHLLVWNKMDLLSEKKSSSVLVGEAHAPPLATVFCSAKTGHGVNEIRRQLWEIVQAGGKDGGSDRFGIFERHRRGLDLASQFAREADDLLQSKAPLDLAAAALREALLSLDEICGHSHSERILDRIFSQFCIGK